MIFSPFALVTWKIWMWPELDRSFSFNKLKWIILFIFLNQLLFLYILNSSESTSLPLLRYAMLYKLNCIFELLYYCDLLLQFVIRKLDWCEWYFFFTSLWSLDNHNSRTDRFCIILLKYISSLTFVKYLDFLHYFNIIIIMILKLRSTVAETDITSFKVFNKLYNIIKYLGYRFLF